MGKRNLVVEAPKSGYGYGSGYGYYWKIVLNSFAPSQAEKLEKQGVCLAFWRSDKDGKPSNGGRSAPIKVGDIQEESGPLELCSRHTLHATLNPSKWRGKRVWIVALYPPFVGDAEKYGSLKREILSEVTDKMKCLIQP